MFGQTSLMSLRRSTRRGTTSLNCSHQIVMLGQEGIAQPLRPIVLFTHHLQDSWKRGERLDAQRRRGMIILVCVWVAARECWNNAGKHNQEGRPAGECEGLAQGEHGEPEIDGVADMAIGTDD